jgi:uncharacterized protein DUF3570
MQLKQTKKLKSLLTTATCALLGANALPAAQAGQLADWKNIVQEQINQLDTWNFDTALMVYSEVDRVTVAEAIVAGTKAFDNGDILSLKATFDTLTGASANGTVAQANPQTYTSPSGNGLYTVKANKTPLDNTFKDTRVHASAQWTRPLENNYTLSAGGNFSVEFDYISLSANSNISKDFNNKNTTLSAGSSLAIDLVRPQGGVPKALSAMIIDTTIVNNDDDGTNPSSIATSDTKTTVDLLVGLTQVINRRMVMQFNYSLSMANGYLTDPYKLLSAVNADGVTQQFIYENRPDARTKQAFFVQSKYHFTSNILDVSYRYMTDDWGINSHTVDIRYRIPLMGNKYLEPHVRYYSQTAADFYQPFLNQGDSLPEFASADYRIGEMDTYTLGIKYGLPMRNGEKLAFRLEYYRQTPKNAGFNQPGVLAGQDIYENIEAIIAQVNYSF